MSKNKTTPFLATQQRRPNADAEYDNKKSNILFFGKYNCQYSLMILDHLNHLGFEVQTVLSKNRNDKLPEDINWWQGDYIFCFRSYFIIPNSLLNRAKIAAINFLPAPVEFPGSGCINWALYDNADTYGVTAHIMNEKIDNGDIIECRRFPILKQDTVTTLLKRAHSKTYELIIDITTELALRGEQYLIEKISLSNNEKWTGSARKMKEIDILQIVSPS